MMKRRSFGGVFLDVERHAVTVTRSVSLRPAEFEMLAALMERPGVVLSRETLAERSDTSGTTNSVNVHLKNLRRQLWPSRVRIVTVRGYGWKVSAVEEC